MEAPLHITPFSIHIEPEILSDLQERIRKTRWPDQAPGAAWEQGTDLEYLRQLLANFERMRGLDVERKFLRRPPKYGLPNLAPLWTNGNLSANRSNVVAVGIHKRNVNVTVCFHFCINN